MVVAFNHCFNVLQRMQKDAVNNSGSYFIKAKFNGTEKTFSGSA